MKSNAIFQTDSTDDCINLKGKRKKRLKISITDPVLSTISFGLPTAKQHHNSSPQMEFWFSPGEVLLPYLNTPSLNATDSWCEQCHSSFWMLASGSGESLWMKWGVTFHQLHTKDQKWQASASWPLLPRPERDAISLFPTNAKCNWHV